MTVIVWALGMIKKHINKISGCLKFKKIHFAELLSFLREHYQRDCIV